MSGLFYLEECSSTNDEILNFINSESQDLRAVYTFNQTKGRGQYGNSWKSSKNQNIAFSLALNVENINVSVSIFNYYTAVLIRDFIANLTKVDVKIKWPNDILILNKKISGMLIERKKTEFGSFLILGIGINVLQQNFLNLPKAGSIFTQTGHVFELHYLSELLFSFFLEKFSTSVISEKEILEVYNSYLFKVNEISVFEKKGLRQNGIIQFADAEGYLWIELEKLGLQKFYHKEIELLY